MNNEVTPLDLLIWTIFTVTGLLIGLAIGIVPRDEELHKRNTVLEERYNIYWDVDGGVFRYKNEEVRSFQKCAKRRSKNEQDR